MTTIDFISDWASRLRGRLYTQFRNKVTWEKWVTLLARQAQDLENAGQTLFSLLDIDNSEGVQLDTIGRIVGQERLGFDDVGYRLLLRARIISNKSTGTTEDLYKVFRALFGSGMAYIPGIVKQFVLRITTVLTPLQAAIGVQFLGDAEEAGARGILEWQEFSNDSMFYTANCAILTLGLATANVFLCDGSDGFPDSGSVIIDFGLPNQETLTYTRLSPGAFLSPIELAFDHSPGASVELVGDDGLGFGDVNDASVGGHFSGAAQA